MNTILQFLSKANTINSCGDYKAPLAIIEVKEYRKLLFELKKRGIKLRYITDITKDNIKYCKELMKEFAYEIRHVDGIKANFSVSETEYLAYATLVVEEELQQQPMKPIQQVIYTNIKDIVEQQKYVFESFWNKAIPAESRIREIEEEGFVLSSTEVIQIPSRTKELFIDLVKSAKEEVLLLLPTTNAFLREERIGIIQLLRKAAAERRVNVRILTPIDNNKIEKIIQNTVMADQAKNNYFDIRATETTSSPEIAVVGTVTILVVDRKQSLVIEKTDDSKEDFIDAVGLATYSTSKPTVLSYISIFDSLSKQVKLYEQLKTHGKMQEEFINVASHELRTPTQSVLAYSELLRRHPERRDEMIQAIYRNAERLQRLTNDILDVTRIESKTLTLNKEKFNLSDLLSNIVQDYKNNIEKSNGNVRLVYNESNKDSFIVEADRERIVQVISNLLNNAIKFTEETRGDVYVAAEEKEKADQKVVVVTVKDTGIGIDPEILHRLFTKFATKSNTGTGLGLFICKSIIEAHGGKIWAENNKDGKGGSTFAFSLPLSKQQQEQRQLILSNNKVDSTDQ
ncbi:MAG TPA: ATP-binding protein [Nitrososphaeraceae archaeon]|nr:ATP-binding protein [Nitrososphaeraceae archaeon]